VDPDPDPRIHASQIDPDPAILVIDLQDARKKTNFLTQFFSLLLLELTFS
jgi:hypothetical protein